MSEQKITTECYPIVTDIEAAYQALDRARREFYEADFKVKAITPTMPQWGTAEHTSALTRRDRAEKDKELFETRFEEMLLKFAKCECSQR